MAYVAPTVVTTAVNQAGSTVTTIPNNEPFTLVLTLTSSGDVGIKVRIARVCKVSGPGAVFGDFSLMQAAGAQTPSIPKFAGVAKPSTADYIANAGSNATTIIKVPCISYNAGTLVVGAEVELTEDTGETTKIVMASNKSLTIS